MPLLNSTVFHEFVRKLAIFGYSLTPSPLRNDVRSAHLARRKSAEPCRLVPGETKMQVAFEVDVSDQQQTRHTAGSAICTVLALGEKCVMTAETPALGAPATTMVRDSGDSPKRKNSSSGPSE
jgi:hypothetical protein